MNISDESTIFNVALIPPAHITALVCHYSHQLKEFGGSFEVDNASHIAHLTVFMARMQDSAGATILDSVDALLRHQPPLHLMQSGYFMTPGRYYEVSYQRSAEVLGFQHEFVKRLAPLRFSPGRPIRETYFGQYNIRQRLNAIRYGYDLVGQLFRPHITLTRFPEPPTRPLPPPPDQDLSFLGDRFGVFRADHLGAARVKIAEFALRS